MSDEKPSPGPWHIAGYRIRDRHYDDVIALGPGVGIPGTRDDANARLIAAAPEMADLLRDVAHWYCGEMPDGGDRREAIRGLLGRIDKETR